MAADRLLDLSPARLPELGDASVYTAIAQIGANDEGPLTSFLIRGPFPSSGGRI